jgi:hypothetical protein
VDILISDTIKILTKCTCFQLLLENPAKFVTRILRDQPIRDDRDPLSIIPSGRIGVLTQTLVIGLIPIGINYALITTNPVA